MNFRPLVIKQGTRQTLKANGCYRKLKADLPSTETTSIFLNHKIPTACWSFNESTSAHKIEVGMSLDFDSFGINQSTRDSERKQRLFVNRVVLHETCHARFTHDLSEPVSEKAARLKAASCPFSIWNLFEDCYIEHAEYGRTKKRFGWHNFIDHKAESNRAIDLLFELKKREAGSKSGWGAYLPKWLGAASMRFNGHMTTAPKVVIDFFKRAIEPKQDRVQLAIDWMLLFGGEEPNVWGMGDSTPSVDASDGGPMGSIAKKAPSKPLPIKARDWNFRTCDITSEVLVQRNAIANQFAPIVKNGAQARRRNSASGSRLNVAQAAIGGEQSFKRLGKVQGKRSIIALIDQSGSMSTHWNRRGGKEFVSALQRVNEIGLANVQIVYSSETKIADMRGTKADELLKTHPRGEGEGLAETCRKYKAEILKADVAIVFTDGQITDGDVDLRPLRGKTHVIGCCLHETGTSERYHREMKYQFPSVILRDSASGLARAIATSIANS